jgi:hypothetical protein
MPGERCRRNWGLDRNFTARPKFPYRPRRNKTPARSCGKSRVQNAQGCSKRTMTEFRDEFALLIGHAALDMWSDLPRDVQERLFETAVPLNHLRRFELAVYLHDNHPRTGHPPHPKQPVIPT